MSISPNFTAQPANRIPSIPVPPASSLTPEECCFLYPLLESQRDAVEPLKLSIPETIIVHGGEVQAWVHTSHDGRVACRPAAAAKADAIERALLAALKREGMGAARWASQTFIVLERRNTGARALPELGFQRLMTRLASVLERKAIEGSDKLPHCIQSFVWPAMQMTFSMAVSMVDGALAESQCCVGRVEFSSSDGVRTDKPLEAQASPEVCAELEQKAVSIVTFLHEAHGLILSRLVCEFVQADKSTSSRARKEYILSNIERFEVDPVTFQEDRQISPELDAARMWLQEKNSNKVIGRLRRRRSISEGRPRSNDLVFKRRNSLPALQPPEGLPQDVLSDSPEMVGAEELDLPIWRRMSVPELGKAVVQVQKRANQLLIAQEEQMVVGEKHAAVHTKLQESIAELEKKLAKLDRGLSQSDIQHHNTLQLVDQNKLSLREEKERIQGFKATTLHQFEAVESDIAALQDRCTEQEKMLAETKEHLAQEVQKREQLEQEHGELAAEVSVERLAREKLMGIIEANKAAADSQLEALTERMNREMGEATRVRDMQEQRIQELELICEMIGFQKYGGMWDEKKKALIRNSC